MNHYHMGWDAFTSEPGEKQLMRCRVCKTEMDVKRDVEGPTSYASAMMQQFADTVTKTKHDLFTCPHSDGKWHQQVLQMRKLIETTPSATLAMLVEKEMNIVLKNKKATKDEFETI